MRIKNLLKLVPAIFALSLAVGTVLAQDAKEDHSCSDGAAGAVPARPTVANSTSTLRCGMMEMDYGFSDSFLRSGDATAVMTGAVRYGVTSRLEFRGASDTLRMYSGPGSTQTGGGDYWMGARYRLTEQKQTWASLGVMYTAKLPNASVSKGFGTGFTDHAVALLASKDLGKWHADFNMIQTFAGRPVAGFDQNSTLALAVSHPLSKKWGALNELYGSTPLNAANSWFASNLIAATYSATPFLVFDGGVDVGLTPNAPRARLQFGMTYTVGNMVSLFKNHFGGAR